MRITRRSAVRAAGLAVIGVLVMSCGGNSPSTTTGADEPGRESVSDTPTPTPKPTPKPTPEPTPPPKRPDDPGMPPKDPDAESPTIGFDEAEYADSSERKLIVHYTRPSPCSYGLRDTSVDERADAVVVTLHREPAKEGQICAQVVVDETTPVTLDEPLGDRPLVDGGTGKTVKVR